MGFRENLLKKIKIDQLAARVENSLTAAETPRRLDRQALVELLEMGPYAPRRERDLDLYLFKGPNDQQLVLAADNELKIYRTTPEDVALRKSPTIKEMVSIRNAIKILNDKDVVVSSKTDTLDRIHDTLVAGLDLSFTAADIDALAADGRDAQQNKYADGVVEILTLFAELLDFERAPKAFQAAHTRIWGRLDKPLPGEILFGPAVGYNLMHNFLKLVTDATSSLDKGRLEQFHRIIKGDAKAEVENGQVWDALARMVMEKENSAG